MKLRDRFDHYGSLANLPVGVFRSPEEFRFNDTSHSIEIIEMQEGDETELFWQAINERKRQRKYHSLLNGKISH